MFIFVEYQLLLNYLTFCVGLTAVLFGLSFFLILRNGADLEKLSSYECGFDPFEDSRGTVEIHFYLVAILFIIFDVEIMFLFPFVISLKHFSNFEIYFFMVAFFFILGLGLIYEWQQGVLEWK